MGCSMGMMFNFSKDALKSGYEDKVIIAKFEQALKVRHGDATDMGLNMGNPSFKFEMSSTVSLARQYLRGGQNGTLCDRWDNLITSIFPKKKKA